MTSVLRVSGAHVRFGRVEALAGVSLAVDAGTVVGLVGPNGAGKTTLLDAIAGLVPLAGGRVALNGADITGLPPHRRARLGLGRTFQARELFADLTAGEHLLVASESAGRGRRRRRGPRGDSGAALAWAAAGAGLDGEAAVLAGEARPSQLSHGQQVALGLGRALASPSPAGRPALVVLDEPFAGLDGPSREAMAARLRRLAGEGMAVLLADHDLGLVLEVCDLVCVLDFGRVVAFGPPASVRAEGLRGEGAVAAAYFGGWGSTGGAEPTTPASPGLPRPGPPRLKVEGLVAGYGGAPAVRGLDLEVGPGEVVALLGPNGAGKTTTLAAVSGLLPAMGGRIEVLGRAHPCPAHRLARRGLAHVQQDRGVISGLTVAENLSAVRGGPSGRDPADAALDRFPALRPLAGRRAGLLSGGEQHLLALARALASRPRLLLVDELSLGLAPVAAGQALVAVKEVAAGGAGVVVVEQHPDLALAVATWAVVLSQGVCVFSGPAVSLAADPGVLRRAYLG